MTRNGLAISISLDGNSVKLMSEGGHIMMDCRHVFFKTANIKVRMPGSRDIDAFAVISYGFEMKQKVGLNLKNKKASAVTEASLFSFGLVLS